MINSSQSMVASYRYDPFGNTISSSGTLASANTYRFSSKEIHVDSGLYYYGYRFYAPHLQRWMNRDPIQEWGGINLYAFVGNSPADQFDPDGTTDDGRSPTYRNSPTGNAISGMLPPTGGRPVYVPPGHGVGWSGTNPMFFCTNPSLPQPMLALPSLPRHTNPPATRPLNRAEREALKEAHEAYPRRVASP